MESTESKPKREVTVIPPTFRYRTNVAIYCRVSSDSKEQLRSLTSQVSMLTQFIYLNVQWQLVDIYIDIQSGRDTTSRPEFERMINDCAAKKVQKIITKSVSRFGRNTVDTLNALNKLRALGVDVFFHSDGINLLDGDNSFMISLLEAIAQEESVQRSENIRWGILKRAEGGKGKIFFRKCFGYDLDPDGRLAIIEAEAEVVRLIFDWYLKGFSVLAILKELQIRAIKSPTGQETWSKRTIEKMLMNEKYAGEVLIMKTYTEQYPKSKRKVNTGEYAQVVLKGSHPAIISEDVFAKVQAMRLQRSNVVQGESGNSRRNTRYSMKKAFKAAENTAKRPDIFDRLCVNPE